MLQGMRLLIAAAWLMGSTWAEQAAEVNQATSPSSASKLDSLLYLTPQNYDHMVNLVGADEKLIILTTLSIHYRGSDHPDSQLDHMRNFAFHLEKAQRLRNTLTVSYDAETCLLLQSAGIPCFVDRVAPQPDQLPGRLHTETGHFAKYWHALALLKLGITVFFSDSDAALLQDPFLHQDKRFDIEGLSDWNWIAELPSASDMSEHPCPIYVSKKDRAVHGGQALSGNWGFSDGDLSVQSYMSPCQSTGAWFASPTPSAILFLEDLLERMTVSHPEQWDQAAWNEVIIAHLFGAGDRPPLVYRLMPVDKFSNLDTHTKRVQQGLPVNQVLLHAGGVHDQQKIEGFRDYGLWRALEWSPVMGAPVLQLFGLELSKTCLRELSRSSEESQADEAAAGGQLLQQLCSRRLQHCKGCKLAAARRRERKMLA